MTVARMSAVIAAALLCTAAAIALVFTSDHPDADAWWARAWPVVGLSFIATGLYATRRRPDSRVGALMVLMGFAWLLVSLSLVDSPALFTLGHVFGGLWGGVFLHLVLSFPSGRLETAWDRRLALAGYVLFTVGSVPTLLFAGPQDMGCAECPENVLLIRRDPDLADAGEALEGALYAVLFVAVLVHLTLRWRPTRPLERLQLTPVYVSGLLTFLLVTIATAGAGIFARWIAFAATAMLPFAFLVGLLRSHVARLDADLRAHVEELRASRARLVMAADTERRRLERDLHDGAQARLVGLAMLLGHVRARAQEDPDEVPALLDEAMAELKTSLAELRELARGINPAVLTERGLRPALEALAAKVPLPVTVHADGDRLPAPVATAAYFAVSEGLANVAKYAQATEATVAVRTAGGRVTVDVSDDGIGGADPARGSGLLGLADRVGALDGTLELHSPPGGGTRLHIELPVSPAGGLSRSSRG
jgi:signal transduction histidine kinase